jgi:hypothetical protein
MNKPSAPASPVTTIVATRPVNEVGLKVISMMHNKKEGMMKLTANIYRLKRWRQQEYFCIFLSLNSSTYWVRERRLEWIAVCLKLSQQIFETFPLMGLGTKSTFHRKSAQDWWECMFTVSDCNLRQKTAYTSLNSNEPSLLFLSHPISCVVNHGAALQDGRLLPWVIG